MIQAFPAPPPLARAELLNRVLSWILSISSKLAAQMVAGILFYTSAPSKSCHALLSAADTKRLDYIEEQANSFRAEEDRDEVYLQVISHYMAAPSERVECRASRARGAIDAALSAQLGEVELSVRLRLLLQKAL